MNGRELLEGLGQISQEFYEEAETDTLPAARGRIRKPLLAAALIAMLLMLTGCAAVVLLHLQDMKITEEPGTRHRDAQGVWIAPTEVTLDVISVRGYRGSPNQLATSEWYEFEHSYDPDGQLAVANNHNKAGIPPEYRFPYGCYTQEMVDKVEEITERYGLKKLSPGFIVQKWQSRALLSLLSIQPMCREDLVKNVQYGSGCFYPEGSFRYEFAFLLKGGEPVWPYQLWAKVDYTNKEYFDPDYISIDADLYEEWNYQRADGIPVLIARSRYGGFLFAEQENAYMTVSINATGTMPRGETRQFSREDMEQIAEAVDFSLRPRPLDAAEAEALLKQADARYEESQAETRNAGSYDSYASYIKEKYIDGADQLIGTPFVRNYYALLDLNGDGVEELLLSDREDNFRDVLTIRDGTVVKTPLFWQTLNLCENNVIMVTGFDLRDEPSCYGYQTLDESGERIVALDGVNRNPKTGSWARLHDTEDVSVFEDITDEEYQAIRNKYPPVDLKMKSISEFPQ